MSDKPAILQFTFPHGEIRASLCTGRPLPFARRLFELHAGDGKGNENKDDSTHRNY